MFEGNLPSSKTQLDSKVKDMEITVCTEGLVSLSGLGVWEVWSCTAYSEPQEKRQEQSIL